MSVLASLHVEDARPGLEGQESIKTHDATRSAQSRPGPDYCGKDDFSSPCTAVLHRPAPLWA